MTKKHVQTEFRCSKRKYCTFKTKQKKLLNLHKQNGCLFIKANKKHVLKRSIWKNFNVSMIQVGNWIGGGKFGNVFASRISHLNFVIKIAKNGQQQDLQRQVRIYRLLEKNGGYPKQFPRMYAYGTKFNHHIALLQKLDFTLSDILSVNHIKIWQACQIGIMCLRQLEILHKKGIVHCDLKENNIMFKDNDIKIIDFNLARQYIFQNQYVQQQAKGQDKPYLPFRSLFVHKGALQMMRDDVINILYMVQNLIQQLPWKQLVRLYQDQQNRQNAERQTIMQKQNHKSNFEQINQMHLICQNTAFSQIPEYSRLYSKLNQLKNKHKSSSQQPCWKYFSKLQPKQQYINIDDFLNEISQVQQQDNDGVLEIEQDDQISQFENQQKDFDQFSAQIRQLSDQNEQQGLIFQNPLIIKQLSKLQPLTLNEQLLKKYKKKQQLSLQQIQVQLDKDYIFKNRFYFVLDTSQMNLRQIQNHISNKKNPMLWILKSENRISTCLLFNDILINYDKKIKLDLHLLDFRIKISQICRQYKDFESGYNIIDIIKQISKYGIKRWIQQIEKILEQKKQMLI